MTRYAGSEDVVTIIMAGVGWASSKRKAITGKTNTGN
jgi:hypothetical protein